MLAENKLVVSRRAFLRGAAMAGASVALATITSSFPSPALVRPVRAQTAIELWYQDWGPLTDSLNGAVALNQKSDPNTTIKLTPLPYDQLLAKLLPSIAAGQEPELMFGYSSWLVAVDITKLFLPVVPELMTLEEAQKLFYPAALAEGTRGDKAYYLPFANGMGGSTFTYNVDILEQEGVNARSLDTWDKLVEAAKKLTRWEGNNLVRAGFGFSPYMGTMWTSMIMQMGGQYYDPQTHKFNLTSPEAIKAVKMIDDLLKVHKVDDLAKEAPSHSNMTGYAAPDGFEKGLAAISNYGSWIVSGYEKTTPSFRAGIMRMPFVGDKQVLELSHNGIFMVSRKVANDSAKKAAALGFIKTLFSAEVLGPLADVYGGALLQPPVVRDPSFAQRRWGAMSKDYDTEVMPYAQHEQHHIADWVLANAWPALLKIWKDSEAPEGVLKQLEDDSNALEEQALERLQA